MIYDLIAPFYDKINADIDYGLWADFIEKNIKNEYKNKAELVLDLACGTGAMTLELAKRGYDMTGVDYSFEMLNIARSRAEDAGLADKMLWLCQDMIDFELYGTVDVVVSCLDSINHITNAKDLSKCLYLIHNYLVPNGLFIFDVNGKYKFENIYADNSYVMEEDGTFCIWQNYYNRKNKICDFYITVFSEHGDGRYERFDSIQKEKMYTLRTLKKALTDNSFEVIGAYADFNFTPATDESERIYIVARCLKG